MFKDEAGEKQIVEFIGLRAKLYSYEMLDASEDKKCKGWQRMLLKGVLNSMTTQSVCIARRNNTEKRMSYEVIVMRFIPKKLIKIPSLLTTTNELLWPAEYTLYLMDIQLKKL